MRNLAELDMDIDSINNQIMYQRLNHYLYKPTYFNYFMKKDSLIMPEAVYRQKLLRDSLSRLPYKDRLRNDSIKAKALASASVSDSVARTLTPKSPTKIVTKSRQATPITTAKVFAKKPLRNDSLMRIKYDSILNSPITRDIVQGAANAARQIKSQVMNANLSIDNYEKELDIFDIQWHKILANSFACIAMFLIGAPLGAIIKKGGLGVPFLVSIFFFIVYYVITMQGEKLAKQNTVSPLVGVWAADVILLIIGLVFLRQARVDARLFDADFYRVVIDKAKQWFIRRKQHQPKLA
jgi:lipopolysaccharide export system permease protein